jgi:hypothetical protein
MRSFEQIPRDLLLDERIAVGARLLYPVLRYLAWQNGRKSARDAVQLPPLVEIAATLGVAESTVKTYLGELRAVGWVETRRAARNRPTLYVIYDDPRGPESGSPESRISADRGGRSLLVLDGYRRTAPTERSSGSPKLVKVEGRNLAADALARECGIDGRSNRFREVATALATGGPNLARGIREMAWEEAAGVAGPGEEFERWLAAEVSRRAAAYRAAMPGIPVTPFALAKWWTDVEKSVASRDPAAALLGEARDLAERGL